MTAASLRAPRHSKPSGRSEAALSSGPCSPMEGLHRIPLQNCLMEFFSTWSRGRLGVVIVVTVSWGWGWGGGHVTCRVHAGAGSECEATSGLGLEFSPQRLSCFCVPHTWNDNRARSRVKCFEPDGKILSGRSERDLCLLFSVFVQSKNLVIMSHGLCFDTTSYLANDVILYWSVAASRPLSTNFKHGLFDLKKIKKINQNYK